MEVISDFCRSVPRGAANRLPAHPSVWALEFPRCGLPESVCLGPTSPPGHLAGRCSSQLRRSQILPRGRTAPAGPTHALGKAWGGSSTPDGQPQTGRSSASVPKSSLGPGGVQPEVPVATGATPPQCPNHDPVTPAQCLNLNPVHTRISKSCLTKGIWVTGRRPPLGAWTALYCER